MEFLPYNNSVQVFQPPFGHHSNHHEYVLYPDAHTAYAMPRRSASMTNMNQVAMGGHAEKNDSKPRLSKSEVEILERQFQEQHKPTSNTKRQLAERMRVDISRINVSSSSALSVPLPSAELTGMMDRTGSKTEGQRRSRRRSRQSMAYDRQTACPTRSLRRPSALLPSDTRTIRSSPPKIWSFRLSRVSAVRRSRPSVTTPGMRI